MKQGYLQFLVLLVILLMSNGLAYSSIVMNEVYTKGTEAAPDWVELYNNSAAPVDVSGYKIYDSGAQSGSKPKKEIAAGTTIAANDFLVIITDDTTESGFGLSSSGEVVWLEDNSGALIDTVAVPALQATQSYARIPDGGPWQIVTVITPGTANSFIKMNEIYSNGTETDPDWIEIYNASADPIDISGYKIYDSGGQSGSKPKKEIPAGTILPGKGFYVVVTDDGEASAFGLSSKGEAVWLEDSTGAVVDTVFFAAMNATQSFGRLPDGGIWQLLTTISRGISNMPEVVTVSVKMNEIYSRGVSTDPDWIEIYNGSTTEVDISGYKIYDSNGQSGSKPKMEFPAGTIIPAYGYFVIVTDTDDASGFGLSSNGEQAWLEDTTGTVIDEVTFPALSETQSYGRLPDGGDWQILEAVTRGTANKATGVEKEVSPVIDYALGQNYPNPFNPQTNIRFSLPANTEVTLAIYTITGQFVAEIVNSRMAAGVHTLAWDASALASGVYVYTIKTPDFSASRKMLLLK